MHQFVYKYDSSAASITGYYKAKTDYMILMKLA